MLFDLKMMGFEHDIALFALKTVQYQSQLRAVDFLTEKGPDGKYEHPFVGVASELCKICLENKELHNSEMKEDEDDDLNMTPQDEFDEE